MIDPQNDWTEDGTCIRCDGYATVSGNGNARNGVTISCEGGCGTYGAHLDNEGDLVEYPAPAPAPVSPPPPADFYAADTFGSDPF